MVRKSGVLMHISSLPSPYGIGTLGKCAYEFVDFLRKSGNKYWQVLPLGPTGYGDSPYQSFSTFAGNPYFIDLDELNELGILNKSDYANLDWGDCEGKVDYEKLYNSRFKTLQKSYDNFKGSPELQNVLNPKLEKFANINKNWVYDYGMYMSIKAYFGNKSWQDWEDQEIKNRYPERMGYYWEMLQDDIQFWVFIQFLFFEQWQRLKNYAKCAGVEIIGDIPIYVAMDSVDVWANPQLFCLDEMKNPLAVAGCPPDYFSEDGQLWGNPIYDWKAHKNEDYYWWFSRLEACLNLYDVVRIDHFRGFESFYAIPYGAQDAKIGEWVKGPGLSFIERVKERFGINAIIAEDLGLLTDEVIELLKDSEFPGMKVLQFAFDTSEPSDYLPHKYEKNCVVYTGTHDNTTLKAFLNDAPKDELKFAEEYLKLTEEEGFSWGIIRGALSSVANLSIIPMQDYLELSGEARMNEPSTLGGNWQWRLKQNEITVTLANKIHKINKCYGRV